MTTSEVGDRKEVWVGYSTVHCRSQAAGGRRVITYTAELVSVERLDPAAEYPCFDTPAEALRYLLDTLGDGK